MTELSNSADALFDAVEKKDFEAVKRALGSGANPNAKHEDGDTVLLKATMKAIDGEGREIVELLLQEKANPNLEGGDGNAPIHYVVLWWPDIELMQLLLNNDADINLKSSSTGQTPLFTAVFDRNDEMTKLLLENGANTNIEVNGGDAPLHHAAYMSHNEQIINLLLENGADVSLKSSRDGNTPLFKAVEGGSVENVKKLPREVSDLRITSKDGTTLLHVAARHEKSEIFDLLWSEKECPIDVNTQTMAGETPLFFAARNGSLSCVEWLIENGAQIDIVNKFGVTPFLRSAQAGDIKLAELLIHKSDRAIYAIDDQGRGALHYAAQEGRSLFLKWLLKKKSEASEASEVDLELKRALNPNRTDKFGKTIIHHALEWWQQGIVERVLEFCEQNIVNEVDDQGNTPLHIALSRPAMGIQLKRLLMKNMSSRAMNSRNSEGNSILSLAAKYDDTQELLLDILKLPVDVEHHKSINDWPTVIHGNQDHAEYIAERLRAQFSLSSMPKTAIFWAARNGAKDLVKDSLSNTSIFDSDDKTNIISETLYWASAGDQYDIVADLMERYKDDILPEEKTMEAVQVAASNGYEPIVQLLLHYIREDDKRPKNENSTALFWAVTWEHKHARDVVRYLLMNGASPDAAADGGKTVLEWAQSQNTGKNRFPMLGLLESPIRVPPRPIAPKKPLSKGTVEDMSSVYCTIVDFYCQSNAFYTLQRKSNCQEVIYTEGPAKKMKESWREWFSTNDWRRPDFRWIHLPLNDWTLAQDLMEMVYYESRGSDAEYTRWKTFVKQTRKEHTGSAQSRFMYPTLHFQTKDHGSGQNSTLIQLLDNEAREREQKEEKAKAKVKVKVKEEKDRNRQTAHKEELRNNRATSQDASKGEDIHTRQPDHRLLADLPVKQEREPEADSQGSEKREMTTDGHQEDTSNIMSGSLIITKESAGKTIAPSTDGILDGSKKQLEPGKQNEQQISESKHLNIHQNYSEKGQPVPRENLKKQEQLEKCKVALYMPFLTLKTVQEQRKRRQQFRKSEIADTREFLTKNEATVNGLREYTKKAYRELANSAREILKKPDCNPHVKEILLKAIRSATRDRVASNYDDEMTSQRGLEALNHYLDSLSKEENPFSTQKSSSNATLSRKQGRGFSKMKGSITDMIEAIEYFIDGL